MTNPRKRRRRRNPNLRKIRLLKKNLREVDETIEQVFNTLNEKQKNVVYAMIGQAIGETDKPEDKNDDDSKGGNTEMKHNVFDNDKKNETGGFSDAFRTGRHHQGGEDQPGWYFPDSASALCGAERSSA